MNKYQLMMLFVIICASASHAHFIKVYLYRKMNFVWHCWQLIPLFFATIAVFIYAFWWTLLLPVHSAFGNIGIGALPLIVMPWAYVISYHWPWRTK